MRLTEDTATAKRVLALGGAGLNDPCQGFVVIDNAGVVQGAIGLDDYDGQDAHVTFYGENYLTRAVMKKIASHVFDTLKCVRATAFTTRDSDAASLEICGFVREGVKRGTNVMMYGLLKDDRPRFMR
jgi:hypothetical protein